MLKKCFGLVSIAAMVAAVGSACSSSTVVNPSGGGDDSGTSHAEGGHDAKPPPPGDDSGQPGDDSSTTTCAPGSTAGFKPTWKPPAPHQNICTQSQIDGFFTGCIKTGSTNQTCAPYGTNGTAANQACAKCLITAQTASSYGALIDKSGVVEVNIAGCLAIAEGKIDGSGCAGKLQAGSQCDDAACKVNCPVTDDASFKLYQQCTQTADQDANLCGSYATAAQCADVIVEGGTAGASCLQGQTFDDLYAAVAPVFCLSNGSDGGGAD
jgi:hypothetical protein